MAQLFCSFPCLSPSPPLSFSHYPTVARSRFLSWHNVYSVYFNSTRRNIFVDGGKFTLISLQTRSIRIEYTAQLRLSAANLSHLPINSSAQWTHKYTAHSVHIGASQWFDVVAFMQNYIFSAHRGVHRSIQWPFYSNELHTIDFFLFFIYFQMKDDLHNSNHVELHLDSINFNELCVQAKRNG